MAVQTGNPALARGERLRADLALLAVALIWGGAIAAQRATATQVGPILFTGVRFLLGALTLLPLIGRRLGSTSRLERRGGALAGAIIFLASIVQQVGLRLTTAGKVGFITGLYVVLVPLFVALIWRRRVRWSVWAAALLAALGLFLLSGLGRLRLAPGDAWVLVGAVGWAWHVIVIGQVAPHGDALRLAFVQDLVCGLLGTGLGLALEGETLSGLLSGWWSVVYTGVFSVGAAFTLQVVGQRRAPAADAAILLSMEGVFAALSGWLFLGEMLTIQQMLGCGLMLAGMLLAQAHVFTRKRRRRSDVRAV